MVRSSESRVGRIMVLMFICGVASSYPLKEVDVDTQLVESSVREVHALPPAGFDLEGASSGGNEYSGSKGGGQHDDVGYLRTKDGKGDHGYQNFDSFHKKGGDSYGYETHSAFGKAQGGEDGGNEGHSGGYSDGHSGGGSYGGHSAAASEDEPVAAGTEEFSYYSEGGEGDHLGYTDGGDGEHYTSSGGEYHGGDGGSGGSHHSEHYEDGQGGEGGSYEGHY